jgi:3-methylcrotonyl-CoA carboxylase alpha subunit
MADEAYLIGPPAATESYLSIDAIMRAARESGAEAIHPGYGFLAENGQFAEAVADTGLTWVGPAAVVIARMGDKLAAKELARAAEIPIVPGYDGWDQGLSAMAAAAETIGYPVMLKATAGGGGRGMRVVEVAEDLADAIASAKREALSAFGDDRLFIEKRLVKPRHVEIQLLLDSHGNGVSLGERECSIQRRFQKVVEESPSPILTDDLRLAMGRAALRLARAAGYVNAGTVEFLFSEDQYYFLEVNARIQVEHPVTEMVVGLDLVRMQIEIAAGERLALSQLDLRPRGHAIEARVYAEDATNRFLPATGTVTVFEPANGPGVRNDAGVSAGSEISPYYDSMLAKLVVHAETREGAVARLRRALDEYRLLGLTTNIDLLRWTVAHPDFERGRFDVSWLDASWNDRTPDAETGRPPLEILIGGALYSTLASRAAHAAGEDRHDPWRGSGGWRGLGLASAHRYSFQGDEVTVVLVRTGDRDWVARIDGTEVGVQALGIGHGQISFSSGGRMYAMSPTETDGKMQIRYDGREYELFRSGGQSRGGGQGRRASSPGTLGAGPTAPMPGTVVKVTVSEGQAVDAHQTLLILEAMKMEHVVEAPHAGVVRAILYKVGDLVPAGMPVIELEET